MLRGLSVNHFNHKNNNIISKKLKNIHSDGLRTVVMIATVIYMFSTCLIIGFLMQNVYFTSVSHSSLCMCIRINLLFIHIKKYCLVL